MNETETRGRTLAPPPLLGVDPDIEHILFITTPAGRWWMFKNNVRELRRRTRKALYRILNLATLRLFEGVFGRRGSACQEYLSKRQRGKNDGGQHPESTQPKAPYR